MEKKFVLIALKNIREDCNSIKVLKINKLINYLDSDSSMRKQKNE